MNTPSIATRFARRRIEQLPGKPDVTAISLVVAVFGYLAKKGLGSGLAPVRKVDVMLFGLVVVYFVALAYAMFTGDPSEVTATGLHQTIGNCDTKDWDLSGYERRMYLCNKKSHKEVRRRVGDRRSALCEPVPATSEASRRVL